MSDLPPAAVEAAAIEHRQHMARWATQYDGRGGIAHEDNGGLRCGCDGWEQGPINGIRPWNEYHAHVATAALSAAMPAITEHLREKVQTAFDDDNEQADGFDSDDYNDG